MLDDLHAADEPSLLLLRFVARELAAPRCWSSAPIRDVDPTLRDRWRERSPSSCASRTRRRSRSAGSASGDVAEYIERRAGTEPDAGLVAAIHAETEGNPLFVVEVVRLLEAEGRIDERTASADPADRAAVIGQRVRAAVRPLPRRARRRLGPRPRVRAGRARPARRRRADELLDVLDEAVAERVLVDVPGSPGRLRFAHALIRDTLYDELTATRRLRAARARRRGARGRHAADLEPHLAELARTTSAAAAAGDGRSTTRAARATGRRPARLRGGRAAVRARR